DFGAAQQFCQIMLPLDGAGQIAVSNLALVRTRTYPGGVQALALLLDRLALFTESSPTLIVHQAKVTTNFRQSQIGVVFPQDQTILRPARSEERRVGKDDTWPRWPDGERNRRIDARS